MKNAFSLFAIGLVLLCACQKEDRIGNQSITDPAVLAAAKSIHCVIPVIKESQPSSVMTRTGLGAEDAGSYPVIWKSGDAIKLYTSDGSENAVYTTSSDGADVLFESPTGIVGSGRLGVYPADKAVGISAGKIQVELSGLASQSAKDVMSDLEDNVKYFPMWAKEGATPGNFSFKNIAGCVALQLNDYQGLGLSIKKVKVSSASMDILGTATVDPSTGAITLPAKSDKNSITVEYATAKSIDTKYIEKSVECFTIAIPAVTYPDNDLTFEITDNDGRVFTQRVTKALTINPGKVKKMAKLQFTLRYGTENCFIFAPNEAKVIDVTPKYTFSSRFAQSTLRTVQNTSGGTYTVALTKEVLWEQLPTTNSGAGSVIISSSIDGYNLSITVGSDEGNALVAIKDGDTIVWSFHIWVTDTPGDHTYDISGDTFQMMDRNLGAVMATPSSNNDAPYTYGMYYQWGRKDPIPTYSTAYNSRSFAHSTLVRPPVAGTHTIAWSIQHPTAVFTHDTANKPWLAFDEDTAANESLWGAPKGGTLAYPTYKIINAPKNAEPYVKTVYDPCPEGYQIPQAYRYTGIANTTIPKIANYGEALIYDGVNTAYYPLTGAIGSTTSTLSVSNLGKRQYMATATLSDESGREGGRALCLQTVETTTPQVSGTSYIPLTTSGAARCVKTSSL